MGQGVYCGVSEEQYPTMQKVLIINGHPDPESYNQSLAGAYEMGARAAGHSVEQLRVGQLNFDANLAHGYRKRSEWEPDLRAAWQKIQAADHLVWVFPLWWGFMPAKLKGLIDRLFLPGLAFAYPDGKKQGYPEPLLAGRTAHLITTLDYPVWFYRWFLGAAGTQVMRKLILAFVGITTTRTTYIGPIQNSTMAFREKWLQRVQAYGAKGR